MRTVIKILTDSMNQALNGNNTLALSLSEKGVLDSTGSVISAEIIGFVGGGD